MYSFFFAIFFSIDITQENWRNLEKNNTNPPLFIFCFASWCPHCHGLINPFQNIQKKYDKSDKIIAATLNCTLQMELCSEFHIRSFPDFIFYYKSKIKWYLNPERTEKGLEHITEKMINYYDHNIKLIQMLYKNNKADINLPRFVCKISSNDTESYSETLETVTKENLVINKTFFFDPDNEDLKQNNCMVFFSEDQSKTMDSQTMTLSEFINDNKIGYFTKSWDFDQISTLNKYFVLVLPNNQESIDQEIAKKFEDYFAYGSIDPLGIDKVEKMFNVRIPEGDKSCLVVIRIKTKNKMKIRYQIIENPSEENIKLFLRKATVKGQLQWQEVNDKFTKNLFSKIDSKEKVRKGKIDMIENKNVVAFISLAFFVVGIAMVSYIIYHFVVNRMNSKEE